MVPGSNNFQELERWLDERRSLHRLDYVPVLSAILGTALILPFLQSIASSAGKDVWDAAKNYLKRHAIPQPPDFPKELPSNYKDILETEYEAEVNQKGTTLQIPISELPGSAVVLLPQLNYTDPRLGFGDIFWHHGLHEWIYRSRLGTMPNSPSNQKVNLAWDAELCAWQEFDEAVLGLSFAKNSNAFWLAISYAHAITRDVLKARTIKPEHIQGYIMIREVLAVFFGESEMLARMRGVSKTSDKASDVPERHDPTAIVEKLYVLTENVSRVSISRVTFAHVYRIGNGTFELTGRFLDAIRAAEGGR